MVMIKKKIGFIFPNKDRRYKTVHMGLGYLAAYARERHPDLAFRILDSRVATRKETRDFFKDSYDLIGVTVFSPVYFEVIGIFNKIRKLYSKTPICLGGPYVTTIMEDIFKKTPADYAIYGEGEQTFSELIRHLKGEIKIEDVQGIMFRNRHGEVIKNPPRQLLPNLDVLPFPAYDLFPMNRYPLHRMISSRGCPYACTWCNSSSIWNQTYRTRDPENVVEEIEFLIENYGKKIFVFGDNSFNIRPERVEILCDLLISRNIDILWSTSVRADKITPELACKMKMAGCYNVAVGVESANNEILRRMNKQTTIEEIAAGIRLLKAAGIEVLAQYVIGSPGETLETVKESIEFARKSGSDFSNFYTVLPFKGTGQWEYILECGNLYTDQIHDFHNINPRIVFDTPEFPYEDRLKAIELVRKEGFYSNKDKKSLFFDLAKDLSLRIQQMLPESIGNRLYVLLKSVYRLRFVKKHNI